MLKDLLDTCKAITSKMGRSFSGVAGSISEGMKEFKEIGKSALPEITDGDIAGAAIRRTSIAMDIETKGKDKESKKPEEQDR